jgi:hypothetical protein
MYAGSHLIVAAALKKVYERLGTTNEANASSNVTHNTRPLAGSIPWGAVAGTLKRASSLKVDSSDRASSDEPQALDDAAPTAVLEGLLEQPTLRSGSVLLIAGTLVHGTMRASEAMPGGEPRVIMNAKVCFKSEAPHTFVSS